MFWFVDDIAETVKSQDVIAHAAGPAWLHFVLVAEQLLPSHASAIVQLPMGQHPK